MVSRDDLRVQLEIYMRSADLIHSITVDGGHRAIVYTRIGGVKKDIYNEGDCAAILTI